MRLRHRPQNAPNRLRFVVMCLVVWVSGGIAQGMTPEEEFMGGTEVRYQEQPGKPQFGTDMKPNAYWAQLPTGRFTQQELFGICAVTALVEYRALNDRIENRKPIAEVRRGH